MSEPTKPGWDGYRLWRKVFWISVLAASVLAAIGSCWSTRLGDYPAGLAALVAFVCSTALQHYKCPRCRKPFFYDGMWNSWRENCVHCGLPKWKEADYVNVNRNSEQVAHRTLSIAHMAADQAISALERDSKFLLLVLRDDPGAIHLAFDSEGWADMGNLLDRANLYGIKLTREGIENMIATKENPPVEWDYASDRIRACR